MWTLLARSLLLLVTGCLLLTRGCFAQTIARFQVYIDGSCQPFTIVYGSVNLSDVQTTAGGSAVTMSSACLTHFPLLSYAVLSCHSSWSSSGLQRSWQLQAFSNASCAGAATSTASAASTRCTAYDSNASSLNVTCPAVTVVKNAARGAHEAHSGSLAGLLAAATLLSLAV